MKPTTMQEVIEIDRARIELELRCIEHQLMLKRNKDNIVNNMFSLNTTCALT